MVWCRPTFFFHRSRIHKQYKEYFGIDEEDERIDKDGDEDIPQVPAKEAVARFYFNASLELAQNDITKLKHIDSLPVNLCLNVLARNKDIREAERKEM